MLQSRGAFSFCGVQGAVRTLEDTIETFLFKVQDIYDNVSQISKISEAPCV